MIRLVFRALGLVLIAAALAAVVIDAARSIAASAPALTSTEAAWFALHPASLVATETFIRVQAGSVGGDSAVQPVISWVLAAPASAVLAIAGFLLLLLGAARNARRPARPDHDSGVPAAGDTP
jgi:hypothetical protein